MRSPPLRIVFAGTPEFAATHLSALQQSGHELVAVYTQPDRPAGRGKKLTPSPVKLAAEAAGLRVFQPASLKDEAQQRHLAELNPDVLVVVAYGLILPQAVLDIPRLACLNVHASLLPRWRGAAPIQRAIEAGDSETGITIMRMDAGLDTGDMLATGSCPIGQGTTAASLHDQLADCGTPLLLEVLEDLPAYLASAQKQDDAKATYAKKILKTEAEIDWNQKAIALDRAIRAFNPFPVCFTSVAGQRLKIWEAQTAARYSEEDHPAGTITRADRKGIRVRCGAGELIITRLQLPGGKVLDAAQMLNAKSALFTTGARLGEA
jgi:methionyl-tRNA formyltransferase